MEEQLAGEEPKSSFGLACAKLGIEIVKAHSAQAKGRVERSHAVYQDRFLKELALRRITTIEAANRVLTGGFVNRLNQRFAGAPRSDEDFHHRLDTGVCLEDVFSIEDGRVLQNDWTIRHENSRYQILEENRPLPKPKDKILVRQRLDGSLFLIYDKKALLYKKINPRDLKARAADPKTDNDQRAPLRAAKTKAQKNWRPNVTVLFADKDPK